ncbi:MAG: NAD(P)H-hydrate dehydratase, partial [Rhodobacterales bacterium]
LGRGPDLCGALRVADIGLPVPLGAVRDPEVVRLVDRPDPRSDWPLGLISKARGGGHKFNHGHVMVFAGGVGRGGAGRLAARAALRAGAGLVTLLCPPAALQENACQLNAIMLQAIRGPEELGERADTRVSGFCLGPGMGVSVRTRDMVLAVLARRDTITVLDADALSSFADAPEALFAACHPRVVLTPHEGEFARLFPDLGAAVRMERSKVEVVRQAAERAGCIMLLKGADTVIAAPDGAASLHAAAYGRSAPWLATAGAGDVLAGLIAGLAAPQGAGALMEMVEAAAWLHVECARRFGPGLIAEDLPDILPRVLQELQG